VGRPAEVEDTDSGPFNRKKDEYAVSERSGLRALCRDALFWDSHGDCSIKTMAGVIDWLRRLYVREGEACGWMDEDWLGCFCTCVQPSVLRHMFSSTA